MNEGHSAFLSLERMRQLMENNHLDKNASREVVYSSNVFTTHTPVSADNDVFPIDMEQKYFREYVKHLFMYLDEFLRLGSINHK